MTVREMIACEGFCYASECPKWASCHKQWDRAEGSNDGQSDTAVSAVAPQPDTDPIVAD